MPAATAYRGKLYVMASTLNEPYRVFSATAVKTLPQPGDTPEGSGGENPDNPGEIPWTDLTPATPVEPSSGEKLPSDGEGLADGESKKLASTGDPLGAAVPVIVFAAVVAGGVAGAGAVAARRRKAQH